LSGKSLIGCERRPFMLDVMSNLNLR